MMGYYTIIVITRDIQQFSLVSPSISLEEVAHELCSGRTKALKHKHSNINPHTTWHYYHTLDN